MPATKSGVQPNTVIGAALRMLSYEQITDLTAASPINVSDTAVFEALIQAEGAAVRWRADGVAPTSGTGMTLADGESLILAGADAITKFRAIGAGAKLNVSLWG